MAAKIFVNYRRDDVPGDARGVRDGLAAKFGKASVFMDVDNLLVGQRFDIELAKALDTCDVLIAVIGPRWMELLTARTAGGERDYVREEIRAALARRIVVIPVRVGREGSMPALPRRDNLPEDIRDLVLHQKLDIAHERFGRDIAELNEGIVAVRKSIAAGAQPGRVRSVPLGWIGASIAATLFAGYVGAYALGMPVPWPWPPAGQGGATKIEPTAADKIGAAKEADIKRAAEAKAATERQKAEAEIRRKTEEAAEAERLRVTAEQRAKEAAAEAKRKVDQAEARRALKSGETFRDCSDVCPEMVVIPAGEFTMGSNDFYNAKPPHTVSIARPFAVGRFSVTFDGWDACAAAKGCKAHPLDVEDMGWGRGRHPAINVPWDDAKEYAAWLSQKTGKFYRLLSEAEFEYAARAGTTTKYPWGDEIGNSNGCGSQWDGKQTAPVGSFKPNAFGLYDMHGNVWQWVEDAYSASYRGAPEDGSVWTGGGRSPSRIVRGGSWNSSPNFLRSAFRSDSLLLPIDRYYYIGFRVARTL